MGHAVGQSDLESGIYIEFSIASMLSFLNKFVNDISRYKINCALNIN